MKIMGVDYGDARTGIAISDLLCSIVGTGQILGNGNTEDRICIAKCIQPFLHIGAGGTGLTLVALQVVDHFLQVQIGGVDVFSGSDHLHGNGGVIETFNGEDVGRGIGNNLDAHSNTPSSAQGRHF